MADEKPNNMIPIDPEVREVLEEFSGNSVALAAEIVTLRAELDAARLDTDRPRSEIILQPPQAPPDAPPPARLGD